ncbi:unannotated protein [freshwater metagenome]|uniref:Unannotated protein n=1 Tax=freshwater metagenome TaxID=449393 RepID=A0A6J6W9D9_9ZZZZ
MQPLPSIIFAVCAIGEEIAEPISTIFSFSINTSPSSPCGSDAPLITYALIELPPCADSVMVLRYLRAEDRELPCAR